MFCKLMQKEVLERFNTITKNYKSHLSLREAIASLEIAKYVTLKQEVESKYTTYKKTIEELDKSINGYETSNDKSMFII